MAKKNSYTIRGVAHWAKVLGEPVWNYGGDNREWTIDVTPDADGIKLLKQLGVDDRLKNKNDERGKFIQFRQRERRLDGSMNRPISVVDVEGQHWPENKLIGNGSVVDVKFDYRDYGAGKKAGLYPQAIRVLDLKEYQRVEFAPLPEDDPYAPKEGAKEGQLPEGMEPEAPKVEKKEVDPLDDDFPE